MAFNGSGVFQRLYNWVNDANGGVKIRADRMDAEMDGFATGLSSCVTKDGQTTITANLPMATFKFTGLGSGSARTDSINYGQVQDGKANWVDSGGTADAITATYSPAITALVDGQICYVRAGAANATTTPTFSPNGLTARTIVKTGGTALVAGDISGDGHELILRYDLSNTRWELLNPATPAVGISSTYTGNNTFSGTTTFSGIVKYTDDGELTISSGAITITGSNHTVDTESDASTDDLDTINGGVDGARLVIRTENSSRDVVLKDGTGNIETPDGNDITLDAIENAAELSYDAAQSKWLVLSTFAAATSAATTSAAGIVELATDAEVVAETDAVVPEANQIKHSPGVAKAWVNFDSTGSINDSYNVASITDSAVGKWVVVFDTDFADTNYVFAGSTENSNDAEFVTGDSNVSAKAVGSVGITNWNQSGTPNDADGINFVAWGVQ